MAAKVQADNKPAKPYPEFPLYAHRNRQWAKKIKGKTWFFGIWGDPDASLQAYLDQVDDIQAGRDPRRQAGVATPDGVTISDMVNLYLGALEAKSKRGEITGRHFSDCIRTGKVIVEHFGRKATAGGLKASDFAAFRESFPSTWGLAKTATEIQRIRTVFKWAAESEIINGIPNFGPEFKKPPKRASRIAKAEQQAQNGDLAYSSEELRQLLAASSGWLKASILLGINCGFGNADCGRLQSSHIDFDSGWYDLPRIKTGIPRQCYVWTETRNAIQDAMAQRPVAKNEDDDALCFLTSHGRPVYWESTSESGTVSRCDNVGKGFSKLVRACGLQRQGRGFYSLRRTFETVASGSKDQVAVDFVMGHSDESMAAVYRQGIEDQRLIDVAEHVRQWLWTRKCDSCGESQFSVDDEWTCEGCETAATAEE
ncbi:MAG: tyrosine-type recombinase/integrase [Fuerstiella sp.]|nr:tyrosine-type recombinase/integrase [Fuerstiella sp.]MCP4855659.1 tyrosine-type recombinase/integrase [Fuerstiella sp.]